jgi:hypothetical protein
MLVHEGALASRELVAIVTYVPRIRSAVLVHTG